MDDKKNIIKLIIIAVELIVVGILLLNGKEKSQKSLQDSEYEQSIFSENSYYTDATIEPEKIHREFTVMKWISYIKNNDVQQSFNMLTDNSKNKYSNDIEVYKSAVTNLILENDLSNISFESINETYDDGVAYVEGTINLGKEKIDIIIEDRGPFNQLIDIKNI